MLLHNLKSSPAIYMRVLISSQPGQQLFVFVCLFFFLIFQMGVKCYHIMALICFSKWGALQMGILVEEAWKWSAIAEWHAKGGVAIAAPPLICWPLPPQALGRAPVVTSTHTTVITSSAPLKPGWHAYPDRSILSQAGEGGVWKGFNGEASLKYVISKRVNSP